MRFGKTLALHATSSSHPYVSYKQLKRLIKLSVEEASKTGAFDRVTNPAVAEFTRILQSDLTNVVGLIATRLTALESLLAEAQLSAILLGLIYTPGQLDRARNKLLGTGPVPSPTVNGTRTAGSSSGGKGRPSRDTIVGILFSASVDSPSPAVSDLVMKMNKAIPALNDLMAYTEVNLAGFRKITKKYYKKTADTDRQFPGFRNALLNSKLQQAYVTCCRMRDSVARGYPNRPISVVDPLGDEIRAALPLLSDNTLLAYLESSASKARGLARSRSSSAGALSSLGQPLTLQPPGFDAYARPLTVAKAPQRHQQQQPQGTPSYGGRRSKYWSPRKGYGKGRGKGSYNNNYYTRYGPPYVNNNNCFG
ncbi:hypothetical protein FOZ63_030021 [Perkinsus olseni]|uniref:SPX domain-containing protein n=2 Tax=Perkinsus olseni TaxID=32597 RepID=A0A7J6QVV8_PEROL|nr:hypothetical protein FOZ63_030021 [Perkinsus olseni]